MKYFIFTFGHVFIPVNSNDYFKALELFNLRKIEDSIIFFKK